jgi:hypothetical protein
MAASPPARSVATFAPITALFFTIIEIGFASAGFQ